MHYRMTTPCDECPFLRTSGFTYLSLAQHARGEFACHKTCDLTEPGDDGEGGGTFEPKGNSPHCAGALIFLEKQEAPHQMMRICERVGLYDRTKLNMKANVGSNPGDYRRPSGAERRALLARDKGD